MKVLLTGAAGFIGGHVVRELDARNIETICVDNFLPDLYSAELKQERWNQLRVESSKRISFVSKDLRIEKIDDLLPGVTDIVNLAAMPGLLKSWPEFKTYVDCNLLVVNNLLESIRSSNNDIRFIQASTSSVYGKVAIGDETAETIPFSPYGVSKLAAENLLRAYATNFGTKYLILRYFSVYGPFQRPDMGYQKFCRALIDGTPINVHGDGKDKRSPTYAFDLAQTTVNAVESRLNEEVMNLAGSTQVSTLEVIAMMADALGVKPKVIHIEKRPGDQIETRGDSAKAIRLLNHNPSTPFEFGINEQIQWNLKNIK